MRNNLCNAYAMEKANIIPIHNCCDVCEQKYSCGDDTCPNTQEAEQEEEAEDEMSREVSEEENFSNKSY